MQRTKIGWTDFSCNPIRAKHIETGKRGWACTRISPGCQHCYAETLNRRWGTGEFYNLEGNSVSEWNLVESELDALLTVRSPARVFVGDMTDIFHEHVPFSWLDSLWARFLMRSDVTFQILTKRPQHMYEYFQHPHRPVLTNVWLGVSIEDQIRANERIPWLLQTKAVVRFLSVEPLLGPIDLRGSDGHNWPLGPMKEGHRTIHWVIIGGESGPGFRPMQLEWLESIVEECQVAGVKIFVKQGSGPRPGMQGGIPDHLWALKEHP